MSAALLEDALVAAAPGPPRTRRRAHGHRLLGLLVPLLLLGAWYVVSSQELLSTRLLPSPGTVATALGDFFAGDSTTTLAGVVPFTGAGFEHLGASLYRCGVSWLLAVAVGTVVGLLLGLSQLARDLLDPLLNALRAVPLFAWLPLALIWFGLGEGAARAIIFVGALWPVLVAVSDAVGRVPTAHVETARMLGTPRRWLWRRVYLPSALPEVVTGLRLSLTLAWTCVIVGELSGTDRGVGAMMSAARETGRTEQVVVGIVVFATVGLVADLLLRAATARWVRWSRA
ncbi:MAG: binding-protein-dependent transport system inner rane component [Frankiales bacterium]|nr:binding-protein-dependent transport system inner rane component [Frankiales bacterium]